jgi:hypothetical protein
VREENLETCGLSLRALRAVGSDPGHKRVSRVGFNSVFFISFFDGYRNSWIVIRVPSVEQFHEGALRHLRLCEMAAKQINLFTWEFV